MKLKCKINGTEYDKIVSGATFSEEFNETLDSGSIILSHIPRIKDLKPYNDVFIWNADETFNGYINKGDIVPYSGKIRASVEPGISLITDSLPGFRSWLIITADKDNFYLSGKLINIWQHFFFDFRTQAMAKKCRYDINLLFNISYYAGVGEEGEIQYLNNYYISTRNGDKHALSRTDKLVLYPNEFVGAPYLVTNVTWDEEKQRIIIPKINLRGSNEFITLKSIGLVENSDQVYCRSKPMNYSFKITLDSDQILAENESFLSLLIAGKEYLFSAIRVVKPADNNDSFSATFEIVDRPLPFPVPGDNAFTLNFTLNGQNKYETNIINADFGELKNSNTFEDWQTNLRLTDYVSIGKLMYVQQEKTALPSFYKHMLVDNYTEEQLNFDDVPLFKYKISLFSETKALEKVVLPNISITQSLVKEKKRSCLFYLEKFLNLYSPKIKKIYDTEKKEWRYVNKYSLDLSGNENSLDVIFGNTICPEMSLTNPTLKELISRIMIVKDCIPVVKDDVIYAMRISETKDITTNFREKFGGEFIFDPNKMSFPIYSMNSSDYSTTARREYSNAISQSSSARYVEYLGFRNSGSATLILSNLQVETRFPIYKINKLYLCYYKKAKVVYSNGVEKEKSFICKHDITDLVLQNVVRNSLSADWTKYPEELTSREEMSKYKILTLGYDIGGNTITGWGSTYSYYNRESDPLGWWTNEVSYLQNILNVIEEYSFTGIPNTPKNLVERNLGTLGPDALIEDSVGASVNGITIGKWYDLTYGMILPRNVEDNPTTRLKTVFFEIDYNAMYNGAVIHGKDNTEEDDFATVDNCSSALSVLEIDGLHEKEKMNRLGNKTFNLQGRFIDYEDLQSHNAVLGSIYDDNIVIYHREYSIYDNYVAASFVGSYDYVLKNYFTTVFAKLRTYNFMSYGESTTRAENIKWYLELSSNTCYFEKNEINNPNILLSSFNKSLDIEQKGEIERPYLLNGGYFETNGLTFVDNNGVQILEPQTNRFYTDFNGFSSGNSLCFNIRMYDNVTHGLYISTFDTTIDKLSGNDVKGSIQQWYLAVNDNEDAFIDSIGCYVGRFNNENHLLEYPRDFNLEEVQDRLDEIFLYPKVQEGFKADFVIGGDYSLLKDNKETLDVTFQIETVATGKKDFSFSEYFLKLNDLINLDLKFDEEKKVYSYFSSTSDKIFDVYFASFGNEYGTLSSDSVQTPLIYLDISDDVFAEMNIGDQLKISIGDIGWENISAYKTLYIYFKELVAKTDNYLSIKSELVFYDSAFRKYTSISGVNLDFIRTNEQVQDKKYFVCRLYDSENPHEYLGYYYKNTFIFELGKQPEELTFAEVSNSYYSDKFSTYVLSEEDLTETFPKTMFVLASKNKIKDISNVNFIDPNNIPGTFTVVENTSFNSVFSVGYNSNNIPNVTVKTAPLLAQGITDFNSIQYWFLDSSGLLRFVFGIDINVQEIEKTVYMSFVKNRSTKVYDKWHNNTAHIVNYLDPDDLQGYVYGDGQKYKENN